MFFGGKYGHGMGGFQGGDRIAPTVTSSASASVEENATLAHALTASETVTWSIVGGADAARFEISGSTLRWAANGTKDFEAPDDANTDNAYVVNVRATDLSSNVTDQTITITVTDVAEGPVLGPELVVNGDFATDSDWTLDQGDSACTISGGELHAGVEEQSFAQQSIVLPAATYHTVLIVTAIAAGDVGVGVGTSGTPRTAPGTYEEDIVSAGGTGIAVGFSSGAAGNGAVGSVSVRQVL